MVLAIVMGIAGCVEPTAFAPQSDPAPPEAVGPDGVERPSTTEVATYTKTLNQGVSAGYASLNGWDERSVPVFRVDDNVSAIHVTMSWDGAHTARAAIWRMVDDQPRDRHDGEWLESPIEVAFSGEQLVAGTWKFLPVAPMGGVVVAQEFTFEVRVERAS